MKRLLGELPAVPVCNSDKRPCVVVSPKSTKGTCDERFASASPVKSGALTALRCLAALGIMASVCQTLVPQLMLL